MTEPAWWWEQDGNGVWQRDRWERRTDGRWLRFDREAVTLETWRIAGEAADLPQPTSSQA